MVWGQAPTRHDTMDVRMRLECLSPGMQDGQEAETGAKMLRVGRDLEQCGGAGLEQQREQESLVLPHHGDKGVRHAEDQMVVADWQQLVLPLRKPAVTSAGLAPGTVSVTT